MKKQEKKNHIAKVLKRYIVFRRSLCVEGFSKEKAKELAIKKTVEMCRKSAKNDTVKAVLAASKFAETKDVVAKMIIEINNLKQDRPNSSYIHKYGRSNNGNGNSNNRNSNGNNSNGRNNNHFQNNRNRNNGGNGHENNRHSNNNNNNYGNRSGYQNGQRSGQNNQSNNYSRNFNDSRRSNDQSIRFISGNEANPGNGGQSQTQEQ